MSESIKKAVVLLSGGLDSSTVLAMAQDQGYACYTLSFDYGQRHKAELIAAKIISKQFNAVSHKVIGLQLDSIGGSALTDVDIEIPDHAQDGIPVTYVPARNTVFLSLALGWAEVLQAQDIFIGVNAVDYSGYPDCRPTFIEAFTQLANVATKAGVEGKPFQIHTPLMDLNKADIIRLGLKLGVDYRLTTSCYQADDQGRACGHCDACRFRKTGFEMAAVADPTVYVET